MVPRSSLHSQAKDGLYSPCSDDPGPFTRSSQISRAPPGGWAGPAHTWAHTKGGWIGGMFCGGYQNVLHKVAFQQQRAEGVVPGSGKPLLTPSLPDAQQIIRPPSSPGQAVPGVRRKGRLHRLQCGGRWRRHGSTPGLLPEGRVSIPVYGRALCIFWPFLIPVFSHN